MNDNEKKCGDSSCNKSSCEGCQHACSSSKNNELQFEPSNTGSTVKKVIGIVSGKGGVGKSLITALTASAVNKKGFSTAILDADITGPSIPKIFGIHERAEQAPVGILPAISKNNLKIMSTNLLFEDETTPVIWRGPIIAGIVKQFWSDVFWGDVDFMFIDMPPGTGDVPLTVFQSIPVDGILIATSPQDLVSMIVEKAVNMAKEMNIPILGIIENMSYLSCPDCGKKIELFGKSKVDEIAKKYNIENVAKLPLNPEIAKACDNGNVEDIEVSELSNIVDYLINKK